MVVVMGSGGGVGVGVGVGGCVVGMGKKEVQTQHEYFKIC